jgi:hypothetical protein
MIQSSYIPLCTTAVSARDQLIAKMQGFNMGRYVPPEHEGITSGNKLQGKSVIPTNPMIRALTARGMHLGTARRRSKKVH